MRQRFTFQYSKLMNGKQLKNSILQWAIQGKLVPQDPNDEPASVLLERIREEKARLVKEKKIKKDKNESIIYRGEDNSYYEKFLATGEVKCIDEEIPFEIPQGWEWCRFGSLMINRDSERIPLSVAQRQTLKKVYDYYGASGVIDKVDKYLFDKDLLLIGEDGANLINRSTPIAFIAKGKYWVNNHAHVLDATDKSILSYVALVINSMKLDDYITGSAQPKLSQDNLNKIPILLPPLEEQVRIIEELEHWLTLIDKIEQSQSDLQTVIKQTQSKILDLAIHGKLVPQDPNDEPASELLKRINPKAEITCDNGHYENLPDSWCLTDIKSIFTINPKNKAADYAIAGFVPMTNILDGYSNEFRFESRLWGDIKKGFTHFANGDIVVAKISPCLENRKSAIVTSLPNGIGAGTTELFVFRSQCVLPEYGLCFFKSDSFINHCVGTFNGVVGQQRVSKSIIENIKFPLPPISEQKRIVDLVHKALAKLDAIMVNL